MAVVINTGKDESFALLKSPRQDGGNFVDDFVEAFRGGKAEEAAGKVWMRLFSEKIPGTEETYVSRIMAIQQDVNRSIQRLLTETQWKTFQHKSLDPLEIKTGHDPWADYFASQGVGVPDD